MHQKVQADFAVQVFRSFATQMVHLQSDLEIAQGQFHSPAPVVELAEGLRGV